MVATWSTWLESSNLSFVVVAFSILKFIRRACICIALAVGQIVITNITFNTGIYTTEALSGLA